MRNYCGFRDMCVSRELQTFFLLCFGGQSDHVLPEERVVDINVRAVGSEGGFGEAVTGTGSLDGFLRSTQDNGAGVVGKDLVNICTVEGFTCRFTRAFTFFLEQIICTILQQILKGNECERRENVRERQQQRRRKLKTLPRSPSWRGLQSLSCLPLHRQHQRQ